MTTNHQPPTQPSLRALARELNIHHSSLSAAIRDGRLTEGIQIDDRGRAVVVDAAAAAANWRGVHMPQILEVERSRQRARDVARQLAATRPQDIILYDRALDRDVRAPELFSERDAFVLLASALVRDALAERSAKTFKVRISKRLREVAELHGAGAPEIARAWDELQSSIDLVKLLDEDEAAEDDTADKAEP